MMKRRLISGKGMLTAYSALPGLLDAGFYRVSKLNTAVHRSCSIHPLISATQTVDVAISHIVESRCCFVVWRAAHKHAGAAHL